MKPMRRCHLLLIAVALCAQQAIAAWEGAVETAFRSSADGSQQAAMLYVPPEARPEAQGPAVPLLVALHTWSGDYRQGMSLPYLKECQERKWVMVHPNFRGPNRRPEACASDLAVQDVLDAVEHAKKSARVDERRIYVVGVSGGGHMALVMAHRAPKLWAGVSAWASISDLAAWHAECRKANRGYYRDVEATCGGPPGTADADEQYRKRSPLFHLADAAGLAVDINAGIHDGHSGSVPVSHTLRAFNVLAKANGQPEKQIAEDDIQRIVAEQKVPEALAATGEPLQGRKHKVLFHRAAGPARVTLFEGGHEIDVPAALNWLAAQKRGDDH